MEDGIRVTDRIFLRVKADPFQWEFTAASPTPLKERDGRVYFTLYVKYSDSDWIRRTTVEGDSRISTPDLIGRFETAPCSSREQIRTNSQRDFWQPQHPGISSKGSERCFLLLSSIPSVTTVIKKQ